MRVCQIIMYLGRTSFKLRIMYDLDSCIEMTCHHECALHCCFLVIYCVLSVAVMFWQIEELKCIQSSSTFLCYLCSNKASVFPLLCVYLLTYVFPQIFLQRILHSIPKSFGQIRVSYQLHKYPIPLPVSIPIIHRIVMMA